MSANEQMKSCLDNCLLNINGKCSIRVIAEKKAAILSNAESMKSSAEMPYVIDRKTFRVMKYLHRKYEIKLEHIEKKFDEDGRIAALYLCPQHYAAYRDENGITFDISSTSSEGYIGLTPLGNKYVEDRSESFVKWFVPLITSSISVAISMLALAASIFLK